MSTVVKTRASRSARVFGVAVAGVAPLKLQGLQQACRITPLAFHHLVAALHANGHIRLSHRAIGAAVFAGRQAQVTTVKQQGAAHCRALRIAGRIADPPLGRGHAMDGAVHRLGHRQVARAAVKGIHMQHKLVVSCLDQGATAALLGSTACAQLSLAQHTACVVKGALTGNAVVRHIDHAPDGAAAIQQGGGPAQHLNPLGGEGVDRHRMVKTQARDIHVGAAVLQNQQSVPIQTTDDRPAHVGAKRTVGDARQVVQRFAQSAALSLGQSGTGELLCGQRHAGVVEGLRGDRDFLQLSGQTLG